MTPRPCHTQSRLQARATVRAVRGDILDLELEPASPCSGCQGLCRWSLNRRPTQLTVPSGRASVRPGDQLRLSVPARAVLQAAVLAYGIPLLTLLGGAVLFGFGKSDLHALAGAILGLAVGLPLGRRLQRTIFGCLVLAADAETAT